MRPQQNRRISNVRRGGAALRRAPNPLTRNYESSGPDVKIRGNAQHIAEKYLALARDAQAAGDRVMGENYLQHAEHYTRIILSAQSHEQTARAEREAEEPREDLPARAETMAEMDNEDEDNAPQPVIEGVPGEVALMGRGGYKRNEAAEDSAAQPRRRRLPARRSLAQPRRRGAAEEGGESRPEQAERPEYSERAAGAEEAERPGRAERPARASRVDSAEPAERLSRAESREAAESRNAAELRADEDAPRAPRRRASAAAGADDSAADIAGAEAAAKPRLRRPRRAKPAAETEQPGNI